MSIQFRIVDTNEVGHAHAWHSEFAAANDAIYPRDEASFYKLTLERSVWCAVTDNDRILGMSYACVSDSEDEVEIGGLMVHVETRGKGIGDILMRLPLCHFIVNERPQEWRNPPKIVTHVLKGNDAPRQIISRTGFQYARSVCIPSAALPGLRTESDGNVHGDEFHLPIPDAFDALATWLEEWNDVLRDGSKATISLLPGESPGTWAHVLRSMIKSTT